MSVVGVVAELKDGERRIALDPAAARLLVRRGHEVRVEAGAGLGAGFADEEYRAAGATIVASAAEAWGADLVVKVKEPLAEEQHFFREGLALFCFLHLAAVPDLARALVDAGVDAFAFETLEEDGDLPLLAPMSEVAGRVAPIVAAHLLSSHEGGSGTLMGGAAGVLPARAVVIGLGVAGTQAARGLRGLDAEVTGVDVDLGRLGWAAREGIVTATLVSSPGTVGEAVAGADVVVGAALVPGARAPQVVDEEHVAAMRPGSVVVDLAIDQGGCVATARPTSLSAPTYLAHGVVHYAVTNVPGQYPRTATRALSAAIAPYVAALAEDPSGARDGEIAGLASACNVAGGKVVHRAVAAALEEVAGGA